jgi:hypothetical protein
VERSAANELLVEGVAPPTEGIFDPSLAYPAGAPSGALAFSAVHATDDITTRVAVSSDDGAHWQDVGPVNAVAATTVAVPTTSTRCPGGTCIGALIHEVPSLVEDALDVEPARRWKVFTHSYLVLASGALAYDLGYLGLYTAPAPDGPWRDEGKAIGWLGESTFSSDGAATLTSALPPLADCLALTEPGALVAEDGTLQLAVGCAYPAAGGAQLRVELLRSTDHARTFGYVALLLGPTDAAALGSPTGLNAPDLFAAGGRTYLSVSPGGPTALGFDGYRGCAVLALAPGGAGVARTDAGTPVVCRTLDGPGAPFAGACSYAAGATALGYLLPQLSPGDGGPFHIFISHLLAP